MADSSPGLRGPDLAQLIALFAGVTGQGTALLPQDPVRRIHPDLLSGADTSGVGASATGPVTDRWWETSQHPQAALMPASHPQDPMQRPPSFGFGMPAQQAAQPQPGELEQFLATLQRWAGM